MPVRIQRKRTKGWQAPAGAIYVGRPSKWGNPFVAAKDGQAQHGDGSHTLSASLAVDSYRRMLLEEKCIAPIPVHCWPKGKIPAQWTTLEEIKSELRGKDLMCWCPLDQPCHADVLLELANQ